MLASQVVAWYFECGRVAAWEAYETVTSAPAASDTYLIVVPIR